MTDAVNEQLSACLDGELSPEQLDLLLKRLERNPELRDAIGRYTVIGEALRHSRPVVASRSFADKVMAAVEQEPAPARRAARIPTVLARSLRPLAGIGVAATVAALAIISVQRTGMVPATVAVNEPPAAAAVASAIGNDDGASYIVPTTTIQSAFVPPATRLTNYVVAHSEYSSPLARRSVVTGVLAGDDTGPAIAVSADGPAEIPPAGPAIAEDPSPQQPQ